MVTFVTACTAVLNNLLQRGVLRPLGLEHLQFLLFIAVIAAFVQLAQQAAWTVCVAATPMAAQLMDSAELEKLQARFR